MQIRLHIVEGGDGLVGKDDAVKYKNVNWMKMLLRCNYTDSSSGMCLGEKNKKSIHEKEKAAWGIQRL